MKTLNVITVLAILWLVFLGVVLFILNPVAFLGTLVVLATFAAAVFLLIRLV